MPLLPSSSSHPLSVFAHKHRNELGLLLAIIAVLAVTTSLNDSYIQKPGYNAKELLRQTSMLGIFALGAAVVIISGGIDLSSGSVIAFSGVICTSIMLCLAPLDENGVPITSDLGPGILIIAILGTLFVAFLIGSFHAWLITVIELPPFVATLASLVALRSMARLIVPNVVWAVTERQGATQINIYDDLFHDLGFIWWIPLVIFLSLSLLLWVLLSRTVIGRHLYAMGGNEEAARLSGIRTDRIKWLAYSIGTITASIAGILKSGYVTTVDPASLGMGEELNAIAAAVVGGCSLAGGVGTIVGTMLGALFLQTVIDAVAKIVKTKPDEFQGLIVGVLVVLAVAFNELRRAGGLKKQFFPGGLGIVNIFVLSLLAGVIATFMSNKNQLPSAAVSAGVVLIVLCIKKFYETAGNKSKPRTIRPKKSKTL